MLAFSVCAFFIYVWSIFHVLYEIPAWVFRLSTWDLIGFIAYTQMLALIESVVIFLVLVFLAAILPSRFFRDKFAAQASMMVLLSSGWAMLAHYNYSDVIIYNNMIMRSEYLRQIALWFGLYLLTLGAAYGLVYRSKKLENLIRFLASRVTVLASVYVAIGFLSLIVVILRNI
jgi:hypothetical protein